MCVCGSVALLILASKIRKNKRKSEANTQKAMHNDQNVETNVSIRNTYNWIRISKSASISQLLFRPKSPTSILSRLGFFLRFDTSWNPNSNQINFHIHSMRTSLRVGVRWISSICVLISIWFETHASLLCRFTSNHKLTCSRSVSGLLFFSPSFLIWAAWLSKYN